MVDELRDPGSRIRQRLRRPLSRLCRLSSGGLDAGFEAVLGGVSHRHAAKVFAAADASTAASSRGLVVIFLASNLPALVVQPLLPALALGRPVLIKSATAEPLFAPAFVDALCAREPRLRPSVAAVTWPGGDRDLEATVLDRAARVLAYGGGEAMRDLAARAGDRLVPYGPKISLAAIAGDVDPAAVAEGLADDVALFDQCGCLSVQAVYTAGDPEILAAAIGHALRGRSRAWPAAEIDPRTTAEVRQLRAEARMRGLVQVDVELREGTVIVEPRRELRPSPGLRTVKIHSLARLEELPALLRPWEGRLQGAALAGSEARRLVPALAELGLSRFAAPGELQSPDATWHNGGVSPLAALG